MIGVVYYADDPDKKIFRKVYLSPGEDVSVLDQPNWVTDGCDPSRKAVLIKVEDSSPEASAGMTGLP